MSKDFDEWFEGEFGSRRSADFRDRTDAQLCKDTFDPNKYVKSRVELNKRTEWDIKKGIAKAAWEASKDDG